MVCHDSRHGGDRPRGAIEEQENPRRVQYSACKWHNHLDCVYVFANQSVRFGTAKKVPIPHGII